MITADQIVAHMVGDYIIQSDWMATEKTKRSAVAAIHAVTYTLRTNRYEGNPHAIPLP